METKIEFLKVSMNSKGLQTARETISVEALTDRMAAPWYSGMTAVLNLNSLPNSRVHLILLTNEAKGLIPQDDQSGRPR